MERIALHTMYYYQEKAVISTVKIYGYYETMVMWEKDGEEIESVRTYSLEEAKKTHNALVNKYNDMIYEGSINKLLGAVNYGQFVKTVKAC